MIGPTEIRNARILIVDDSAVNLTLLTRILDGAGYTAVTTTRRPAEVCALYAAERHDLILLDLMMPEMDGFAVLEGLHAVETEGYVPVIVLTAQPAHQVRALAAGARDFISKPFEQAAVLARIQNVLEARLLLLESRDHARLLEQYDQLTGLPNRRRFRELLLRALTRPAATREQVTVLFVEIDRFQVVNDVLGRTVGAVMLSIVADRLLATLSPMSTLARLDGAVFGLILVHGRVAPDADESLGASPDAVEAVVDRLRAAFLSPIAVEGHDLAATLSIGIALSPADAEETDALIDCAARALREARLGGGGAVRHYSAETNRAAAAVLSLEGALRLALDRDEFTLHYQPKLELATGDWGSVECLLRWDRPGHGPVSPAEFIPVLEQSGLIVRAGQWVVARACRQVAEWERDGLGWIRVAVNVSSVEIAQPRFVAEVADALREHGVPPAALELEITESALMSNSPETQATLLAVKALGIALALDDFGTGYSSLSYLRRYPIDTLKIDISFIRAITTDENAAALVVAMIQMAKALRMSVVAEGVETREQLEFLRASACDQVQGYLFSPPVPPEALAALRRDAPARRLVEA